jgi:hypothetical protein
MMIDDVHQPTLPQPRKEQLMYLSLKGLGDITLRSFFVFALFSKNYERATYDVINDKYKIQPCTSSVVAVVQ